MGGFGSGRWGWSGRWAIVEDSPRLSMRLLLPLLQAEGWGVTSLAWKRSLDPILQCRVQVSARLRNGSVSQPVEMPAPTRAIEVQSSLLGLPELSEVTQTIRAISQPAPLGGKRWWIECPRCHERRTSLYLPVHAGGRAWGCRTCFRLRYLSQRLGRVGRAELQMQRIVQRMHVAVPPDWAEQPPARPKGMKRGAYLRRVRQWSRQHDTREEALSALLAGILSRRW